MDSLKCDKLADNLYNQFSRVSNDVNIIEITDKYHAQYFFDSNGVRFAESGFHRAVQVGDRVFDAITGINGMEIAQYLETLQEYGIIPVVDIIK